MQEYRNSEPEELALNASFQRWQLGHNPVDQAFWQEWLIQNPDKADLVEKAACLLNTLHHSFGPTAHEHAPVFEHELQEEISRLRQSLDRPAASVKRFYFAPVRYGIAASVLILLGLFGWYVAQPVFEKSVAPYPGLITQPTGSLSEVSNLTRTPLLVNLPDSSTVVLYPKSRVRYARQFSATKREVYLSGKGFFTVTKNRSKPFYVYTNNLVTKVLGTSFTIQAYEGAKQIKVEVRTGKVSVFTHSKAALMHQKESHKPVGLVLTPNQQAVFSPAETRLVKTLVDKPVVLQPTVKQPVFQFRRTPIADVFLALNQAYGIKIQFDAERMQACYLTAQFSGEPLFDQLDLICRTINASYEQVDGTIVINSRGCN